MWLLVPPAAAEQRDGVRVLSGGLPSAAGGVLVQVLRLLPPVSGGSVHASGVDREPAHPHGLCAEEGNVCSGCPALHCQPDCSVLEVELRVCVCVSGLRVFPVALFCCGPPVSIA